MAKITKEDGTEFYVPDAIVNDLTLTVVDVYEAALPWEDYQRYLRKKELEQIISDMVPDDTQLVEWARENHPDVIQARQYILELEQIESTEEEITEE